MINSGKDGFAGSRREENEIMVSKVRQGWSAKLGQETGVLANRQWSRGRATSVNFSP